MRLMTNCHKVFVIFKSDFMSGPVVRVVVRIVGQRPKDEVGAETKMFSSNFPLKTINKVNLNKPE